ncbi:MAG: cytochrome c3 family protein [Candidatus Hydrogenedentes bacterium]|nr:cytochrome c3 family protein [Candidatus Hydrogenedentota bacterium]
MSRNRKGLMGVVGVAVVALALCLSSTAGTIAGTDHDFSSQGWSNGEICVVCHTPHNANTTVTAAPLWNHQVSTATYTVYSSGTLNATVGQPDGATKLCLSCHDGTVAIDSFGGRTGTQMMSGGALVGTSLSNDHPVSFTYDSALATTDAGLKNPASATSGLGSTIAADMLDGGKMQCSSCHDVHNGSGVSKLLLKSNAGSALCLTCHTK